MSKGAFQELDAVSLLAPHSKLAIRPPSLETIPDTIRNAYRISWYGRPGTGFVDLPADIIQGSAMGVENTLSTSLLPHPPKSGAEETKLFKIAQMIKTAKAPLVVVGKGAAYAGAESVLRDLIDRTRLPFLPTPMGKGVISDLHPLNAASARSTALQEADVVLVCGARLNWILHFGKAPKWNPSAQFIQVDIAAEEMGRNAGNPFLSITGDVGVVVAQLLPHLGNWHYDTEVSSYSTHLAAAKAQNIKKIDEKSVLKSVPLTHNAALSTIERTLHALSPPDEGGIVYVSEGANTMDISRSIFSVSYPRLRLDAGTHATMGVGLGYAIAAYAAYNSSFGEAASGPRDAGKRRKIVCLEGDSAFGFSAMEVETMARYGMDILIFVLNNGGVYHGDANEKHEWEALAKNTRDGKGDGVLRSTSLGFETRYEKLSEMCGGVGFVARTHEEIEEATREGFSSGKVCVVNVIVDKGKGGKLEFGWQASSTKQTKGEAALEKEKGGRGAKL